MARGLLAVNVAMIAGYLVFGRAADALAAPRPQRAAAARRRRRRCRRSCLALLILGVQARSRCGASSSARGTAVVLAYSILARRYPKEMAGRVNTALNVFGFVGMFSGQWGIGAGARASGRRRAAGYAPEGYPWALGMVWAVQLAGLAWLWAAGGC